MADEVDDFSGRVVTNFCVLALLLGWPIVGCTHYYYNVLPERMAAQGYCWISINVQTSGGMTYDGAYRPCPKEPAIEKR